MAPVDSHAPPTPPSARRPAPAQVLQDGIGRAPEENEAIEPAVARRCLEAPDQLLALDSPLLKGLARYGGSWCWLRRRFGLCLEPVCTSCYFRPVLLLLSLRMPRASSWLRSAQPAAACVDAPPSSPPTPAAPWA